MERGNSRQLHKKDIRDFMGNLAVLKGFWATFI
jgi:hypothetical protein